MSVDSKVVSIDFNNAAFESKIAQTMGSLDKFKSNLDFSGAKSSIADLSNSTNSFNMGTMGTHIEGISAKFLAMSTIAITALAGIASKAIDVGLQIGKSLTITPMLSGFQEYELKMGSIQTIMAGSGASLTEVNSKLNELNEYSDKTIYSFKDMTSNIGKFTNAGVSLDQSVAAIQGVANAAALSGANAGEASRAMYNFGQALSSGSVKLIDWKSIELANMGTKEFKDQLIDGAVAAGTLTRAMDGTVTTLEDTKVDFKTFNTTLEQQWLTSEVLTSVLGDYADATTDIGARATRAATEVKTFSQMMSTVKESAGSGWAMSSEIFFGNFDQAKALWTEVNDVISGMIGESADKRNALLKGWADMGGRTNLIDGFRHAFEAFGKVLTPIKEAFRKFFPATTIANLVAMTKSFERFTEKLIISEGNAIRIKRIFEGVFAVFDIGWEVVKEIANAFKDLFSGMGEGFDGNKILAFFVRMSNTVLDLHSAIEKAGGVFDYLKQKFDLGWGAAHNFKEIVQGVLDLFSIGWTIIKEFAGVIGELFSSMDTGVDSGGIIDVFRKLLDYLASAGSFISDLKAKLVDDGGIADFFDKLVENFTKLKDKVIEVIDKVTEIKDKIVDFFDGADIKDGISVPLDRVKDRFSDLRDNAKASGDALSGAWDKIKDASSVIAEKLDPVVESIKTWFSELGDKLAAAMVPGDFDATWDALNLIFLGGITALLGKLAFGGLKLDIGDGMFNSVKKGLDTLTGTLKTMQTDLKANILLKIAGAIGILAVSLLILSLIDSADLTKAMAGMAVGFTQLLVVMELMGKIATSPTDAAKLGLIAAAMVLLAGAMTLMAIAVLIFSTMSWESLAKGFASIGAGLAIIAIGMNMMPGGVQMVLQSAGLVLIGLALNLIAGAVAIFATMSWDSLKKGFAAVGIGLGIIAIAMHMMPGGIQMVLQSAGLVLIGVALNLIAASMLIFATMSWKEMAKGLAGVAGALVAIAIGMNLMPGGIQMVLQAAGLVLIGIALNAIAGAMLIFGTMSWGEIGKGLLVMAGALVIIAAATNGMASAILGAVAVTLVAISLGLLVQVLKQFAGMSWSEIGKGLLGMVAVLVAIGLTALALGPAVGAMFALGAAMLILGAGFALFGLGAKLVVEAFMLIANGGGGAVKVIILFIKELIKQVPGIVKAFAEGLIDLVLTILKAAPMVIKALAVVIGHILDTIIKLAPKIFETVRVLLTGLLQLIRDMIPEFVKTGMAILVGILTGIRDNIFQITTLVVEIILGFVAALTEQLPAIVTAAITLLVTFVTAIADNIGQVVTAAIGIVTAFLDGIAANIGLIISAAAGLIASFITAIGDGYLLILAAGVKLIVDFLQGISDAAVDIVTAASDLVISFINAIGDTVDDLIAAGVQLMTDFIQGVSNAATDIAEAVGEMLVAFFDAITLQSVNIIRAGKEMIITFLDGITAAADEIITAAVDLILAFMQAISDNAIRLIDSAFEIVITFVNGLSAIIILRGGELRAAGFNLVKAIVVGMTGSDALGAIAGAAKGLFNKAIGTFNSEAESESPSKVFIRAAGQLVEGLAIGLNNGVLAENSASNLGNRVIDRLKDSMSKIPEAIENMDEFSPTITPILDLTDVKMGAKTLGTLIGRTPLLAATLSANQARLIASGTVRQEESTSSDSTSTREIKFEQNNYSPESLSTADIYRKTRNQIELAKKELSVL